MNLSKIKDGETVVIKMAGGSRERFASGWVRQGSSSAFLIYRKGGAL